MTTTKRRGLFRRQENEPTPEAPDPTPVPILDEALTAPCRICGVGVSLTPDTDTEEKDFHGTHPLTGTILRRAWTQNFARCETCAVHYAHAAAFLHAHPVLPRKLGLAVALVRVEAALVALAVLGKPTPDPARLSPAEAGRLLRFLAPIGAGIEWITRADLALGHAMPFPHAYLADEDLANLRSAYGKLLADRISGGASPIRLTPPPVDSRALLRDVQPIGGGCLMCGVGAVTADTATADEVWSLRPACSPGMLGGRPSPARVCGYTCPDCTEALDREGVMGPSAMDRALLTALGINTWTDHTMLRGLTGWGGLVADTRRRELPDPPPNQEPWAHLGDLSELHKRLTRALGVA